MGQQNQDPDEEQREELDPRLAQANKLFHTGTLLIYGKRKSVDRAIKCVQRAIVIDDTNFKYWQLLGEAYYQRGSLNPAINSFMKSIALAEQYLTKPGVNDEERSRVTADCTYNRLRMSDIRLSVSHLEEALDGYSDIISIDAKNVAALTGLSRAKLQLARGCFSNGLVESGHQHCMDALKYALRATCLAPHLCFTWKLASDCCLIQILFGQRGQFESTIDVPEYPGASDKGLIIDQATCIELAQQFLCKALSVEQFRDSASLWHNLGVSFYLKYKLLNQQSSTKELEKKSLLKKSLKCLLKALDNDRTNSQVRNSIGLVSFHLNMLNTSQSFIIKSIQTNMSTSEMQFSNLGYIFLQRGEFRLASVVFNRSQAEEPLYFRSWLGNALLNERSNSDNMTYLRHCHKLDNNYESQLMYATKLVGLPHVEEFNKDLTNALDCMRRVIKYDPSSLESLNTLGLLLERCRFTEEAWKCFERAYAISPKDSRISINRLRQLRSTKAFSEEFAKEVEQMANGGNLEYMLNYVHHLFYQGHYEAVNSRLTRAIEKLPQDDLGNKIGAQILLAMADKMVGRDFKSWLFKNIIDSEQVVLTESVVNLYCLMLFGSTANDQELVGQVSSDLAKCLITYLSTKAQQFADTFYSLEGYWTRLVLFSSIFTNGTNLIRPLVALFPTIPDLWLYLGLSIMFRKSHLQTARYCISRASLIGSTDPNLTAVCDILLAIMSDNQPGNSFESASKKAHLLDRGVHLSRAINKCPNISLLWRCLKEPKESKKSEDEELLNFALDHALRTIIVR